MTIWPLLTLLLHAIGIIIFFTENNEGADVITGDSEFYFCLCEFTYGISDIFYGFMIGYSSFVMCGAFFLVFSSIFVLNMDIFLADYAERLR